MSRYFLQKFQEIAHNVPAVYDVFAVAIRERASVPATAKMWVEGGVGMERSAMT
jgi:hypothetical protein